MTTQIRLRREQDKKFQRTTDIAEADIVPWNPEEADKKLDLMNMCYFCQKCKNHGVLMWKKDHKKNCEYDTCRCELIKTRRALHRHIKCNRHRKTGTNGSQSTRQRYWNDWDSNPLTLNFFFRRQFMIGSPL